jgi:Tol biopolymer transport system component
VPLTASAERLEIEPAFAPDGERLAYVDAATGRVHVAHLRREVRP